MFETAACIRVHVLRGEDHVTEAVRRIGSIHDTSASHSTLVNENVMNRLVSLPAQLLLSTLVYMYMVAAIPK